MCSEGMLQERQSHASPNSFHISAFPCQRKRAEGKQIERGELAKTESTADVQFKMQIAYCWGKQFGWG